MLFIVGLFIGAIIGYATACLMVIADKADKKICKKSKEDLEDWD